jgi:signal transduction histidine kinase
VNPSVLLLSEEPEFARALLARWSCERKQPSFTVLGARSWKPAAEQQPCSLIIAGTKFDDCHDALKTANDAHIPLLFSAADEKNAAQVRQKFPRFALVKTSEGWIDTVTLVATEMLRRIEIGERVREAMDRAREAEKHAVLGRYMLEMRHTLNNALTSVLGNAELLLMEPGALSGDGREQVDTIHTMALRMHEVIQRFSSLEAEMKFAEKDSRAETPAWRSAVSGA